MKHDWTFICDVVKVIDGDTLKLNVDLGFKNWKLEENFRLARIDSPEIVKGELQGYKAKDFVKNILELSGNKVLINSFKHGKYR